MRRQWSAYEDAILRENADHGPSWPGYALLLRGRTQAAITARRKALGIAFDHPGRQEAAGTRQGRDVPPAPARPAREGGDGRRGTPPAGPVEHVTEWSQEEVEALVLGARDLCGRTHHAFAECVRELARVIETTKGK